MVSIQPSFSTNPQLESNSSKKRKFEEPASAAAAAVGEEESFEKRLKAESTKSLFDMDLHLETPLPLEWQRCLDIQSGKIHFYNTRTQTRTCMDPRSPEPALLNSPPHHMSLELELNLPCDNYSVRKINSTDEMINNKHNHSVISPRRGGAFPVDNINKMKTSSSGGLKQNLSWLAVEIEDEKQEQQEMVATVCMRCHMLVMLCKSSPACPNCKFMHPLDQGPPKLVKQSISLLC